MKKIYKFNLFTVLVVAGVSIGSANAFNPNTIPTKIISNYSDNWVEVQNENGITIFFSKIKQGENTYLKIKFENKTNTSIDFSWSLIKNDRPIVNKSYNKIDASNSIEIYDASMLVSINNGESYDDFSVTINLK
jgi:hypothetical protein